MKKMSDKRIIDFAKEIAALNEPDLTYDEFIAKIDTWLEENDKNRKDEQDETN